MKTSNNKIKDENQALIKNDRNRNNKHNKRNYDEDDIKYDDEYDDLEQKQSPAPKMYIIPPNDDYE